jgi:hypothetical protein
MPRFGPLLSTKESVTAMNRKFLPLIAAVVVVSATGASYFTTQQEAAPENVPAVTATPDLASSGAYVLVAWSELGMHCIDGKDYSVFSVLPPYNVIHAQLLKRGEPPTAVKTGVTITYQAVADPAGSINTFSAGKTNFWKYAPPLFQASPKPEIGLAGYATQSTKPNKLTYNATLGYWEAVGIPTVPYDDARKANAYPMVSIVARDTTGKLLASARIVVPVSDEMSCANCHASGSDAAAKPKSGWANNADPGKDMKLNILKKHDDRWPISQYLPQLKKAGWTYQSTLYGTAISGTPVLCAACHSDNALSLPGVSGIGSLSRDMHALHGPVANPGTGITLNQAASDAGSCYVCHPGPRTQCKRGAMAQRHCADCHGTVSRVGIAGRNPWLIEPACQSCHNSGLRLTSAFNASGKWIVPTDTTFATNSNVPVAGSNLYRFSKGHGGVYCGACHNSTHAEFPSLQPNDNIYSVQLQGHKGKIAECVVCHTNLPVKLNQGPHKIHSIGQGWVNAHGDYAETSTQACKYCHGSSLLGTYLSKTTAARKFTIENGSRSFAAGEQVSCGDCHSTPTGNLQSSATQARQLNRPLSLPGSGAGAQGR